MRPVSLRVKLISTCLTNSIDSRVHLRNRRQWPGFVTLATIDKFVFFIYAHFITINS